MKRKIVIVGIVVLLIACMSIPVFALPRYSNATPKYSSGVERITFKGDNQASYEVQAYVETFDKNGNWVKEACLDRNVLGMLSSTKLEVKTPYSSKAKRGIFKYVMYKRFTSTSLYGGKGSNSTYQ